MTDQIRFDDGAAYEQYMGVWSRLVGDAFLDWLAADAGWRWLDIGCGNGAFTEMLIDRCAPSMVHGIDPSEAQLAYARSRNAAAKAADPSRVAAQFQLGDAMALPYPDASFDAAIMPLVIFFVPDPAKGVAEMARVVRPGGVVAVYAWDMLGGGFPYQAMRDELRAMGLPGPTPPREDASRIDSMRELWTGAGLEGAETREISVERTFASFEDFWATALRGPSMSSRLASMPPADLAQLKTRMQARLLPSADGRITYSARANAVKGRVPR